MPSLEIFYGGAARGGKSVALLAGALQYVDRPRYAALLLRRTYADLAKPEALIDVSHQWLQGTGARWIGLEHKWIFPETGATISFGYLDTEKDKYQYQSAAYQYCVAKGTQILMADGSYKQIETLNCGDRIMTLLGPRPVTFVSLPQQKQCYELRALGSSTIVSEDHKILTERGWVSPKEQRSIVSRESSSTPAEWQPQRPAAGTLPWSRSLDLRQDGERDQQNPLGMKPLASGVLSADCQNDCEAFDDGRRGSRLPVKWNVRATLLERGFHQAALSSWRSSHLRESYRDRLEFPPWQDSFCDCPNGSGCNDGQFRAARATCRERIPLQRDAGDSNPLHSQMDDPGSTPKHNRVERFWYVHPYTNQREIAREPTCLSEICMVPAGVRDVFDLRVAGASHYVSWGGIISQNCGFDELSQFSESQYTYLFSRLVRLADSGIPLRMRAASNPGGVGHEWVKSRFVRPVSRNGFERVFIPARLEDNPGVDQEAYRKSLSQLDYVTRMQLEDGDWDIQPAGNMFKRQWFEIVEGAPAQATRTRAWDFAATEGGGDYTVGTRMSRTSSGLYYIEHVLRGQWSPRGVESIVLQTAKQDGTAVRIRMEQEPGSSGKMVVENWIKLLAGYDVGAVPATGEKSTRWRPLSAQCEAGNVKLVRGPWVETWLQEMERVPQEGQHDDQADSASIAFNDLTIGQTNTAILEYYQQLYEAQLNAQKC